MFLARIITDNRSQRTDTPFLSTLRSLSLIDRQVPEHFSSPLHMAVELGFFEKEGVVVERVCCPSGTGEVSPDFLLPIHFSLTLSLSLVPYLIPPG